MRCGSCNEVFDGNAALLEPPTPLPVTPLPVSVPFDQKMAALDSRAAEVLAEPALELDTLDEGAAATTAAADATDATDADAPTSAPAPAPQTPDPAPQPPEPELAPAPEPQAGADNFDDAFDDAFDDEAADAPAPAAPFPLPAEPAILPADREALFDLDLDMESEPDLEASSEPEIAAVPITDDAVLPVDSLSDDELEAALEAELAVMEQSLADLHGSEEPAANDTSRREPSWDEPALDEPQAGGGPALDRAFAAADDAIFSAEQEEAPANASEDIDADLASFSADDDQPAGRDALAPETAEPAQTAEQAASVRPLRDDELDEIDEEALVQLSSAGMSQAQVASAHTYLLGPVAAEAPAHEEHAQPEEPGFVKRDRLRRKYGKAATIGMSLGSLLLVLALFGQAITTFRNSLAAALPALKPALTAACTTLGCKIELPTQIDDLVIEQGELQTLSDTAFSFTTLLRNQSRTTQAWPSIELTLDDANDKRILRRVFTPRDYLGADAAPDQGFAPHSEQAVKLYFELRELKASGYHIAVFYP